MRRLNLWYYTNLTQKTPGAMAEESPTSKAWALPALFGGSAVILAIFPERWGAVFLGLAAVFSSPVAAEIFGGFSITGLSGALASVKKGVVDLLVEVLNPSLQQALPPALVKTFEDERMAHSIVGMMDNMMSDPKFLKVLKNFINTSMTNEELLGSLKKVMQEALADSHLYKSAMHGMANSLNPLHSETLGRMLGRAPSPNPAER
ncbi:unnamed protein product [Effrenium voratum]|uniref:Uncharacterized protein n=1 Tax=Effrenium voratum TaxID=2562239 RepID=A0AA36NM96_9DINO|nr:unnamed protein product [Effrenium voratum]CAJ1454692.1 unnamed protein product [Effrenium voratum]